jgi:hypothetical protein
MEKLELKYLAPYLPYGLMCSYNPYHMGDYTFKMVGLSATNVKGQGVCCGLHKDKSTEYLELANIKLFLKPLSELELDGKINPKWKFIYDWYSDGFYSADMDLLTIASFESGATYFHYKVVEKLFENHFDVFGLIKAGLAIDVNTLVE